MPTVAENVENTPSNPSNQFKFEAGRVLQCEKTAKNDIHMKPFLFFFFYLIGKQKDWLTEGSAVSQSTKIIALHSHKLCPLSGTVTTFQNQICINRLHFQGVRPRTALFFWIRKTQLVCPLQPAVPVIQSSIILLFSFPSPSQSFTSSSSSNLYQSCRFSRARLGTKIGTNLRSSFSCLVACDCLV